jgi:hypothetical protein
VSKPMFFRARNTMGVIQNLFDESVIFKFNMAISIGAERQMLLIDVGIFVRSWCLNPHFLGCGIKGGHHLPYIEKI